MKFGIHKKETHPITTTIINLTGNKAKSKLLVVML